MKSVLYNILTTTGHLKPWLCWEDHLKTPYIQVHILQEHNQTNWNMDKNALPFNESHEFEIIKILPHESQ